MFSKFLNLDPDKQACIINAAIKEFAQNGYKNASTNEIVKEAGISKGLLFHYFRNKKELYLFLFNHSLEVLTERVYAKVDWNEQDIFNKYRQIAFEKMGIVQQYPEMFNFLKRTTLENSPEIKKDIEGVSKEKIAGFYSKFLSNLDASKFKEGTDVQKALNIIFWTLEGLGNQYSDLLNSTPADQVNMDEILAAIDNYLDILRTAFYKS